MEGKGIRDGRRILSATTSTDDEASRAPFSNCKAGGEWAVADTPISRYAGGYIHRRPLSLLSTRRSHMKDIKDMI
ncbi:hypothetical protein FIBSPDRAFT_877445 [Athelia psychrophila]|uniref:Uncharacterized protein n=1 Tax=Athelia psychrophila TaxID=1759441 RepID=A0A167VYQ9_9AGAM|nr:hypothetical protein FIBSPDRAFT_877445 [Fibularhizoctonia sp. CBS 109695]